MKNNEENTPCYLKTPIVIITTLLGSLLGFATIASLLGVKVDDELNKDYYKSKNQQLFKKKTE